MADALFNKFDLVLDNDDELTRGELERIVAVYDVIGANDLDDDGELSYGELRAMSREL